MELMVVVSLILILLGVGMTNYITQLKRSRDARRKADLEQIRAALEMYRADEMQYPLFGGTTWGWTFATNLTPLSNGGYLNPIPKDPKYEDTCPGYLAAVSAGGANYTLFVALEVESDPDATKVKPAPAFGPGSSPDGYRTFTIGGGTCAGSTYNYWINNP